MSGEDKRKFPRLNLDVEVNYSLLQQERRSSLPRQAKISATAVSVLSPLRNRKSALCWRLDFLFHPGLRSLLSPRGRSPGSKELDFSGLRERRIYEVGLSLYI